MSSWKGFPMKQFTGAAAGLVVAFLVTLNGSVDARQGRTVWDGVYSLQQASDGKIAFAANCAACHGDMLEGDRGPSLIGDSFKMRFENDTVERMFTTIRTRMPQSAPGTLTEEEYLNVVAFLLQSNKYPPGRNGITPETLTGVAIVPEAGATPAEAPNFALVAVVGCLTQQPDNSWAIANASAPVVTRDANASKDEVLAAARARAMGTGTFRLVLLSVPPSNVAPHKGNKVEAKGLLIKDPTQPRLNVSSLQRVGDACAG